MVKVVPELMVHDALPGVVVASKAFKVTTDPVGMLLSFRSLTVVAKPVVPSKLPLICALLVANTMVAWARTSVAPQTPSPAEGWAQSLRDTHWTRRSVGPKTLPYQNYG